MEFLDDGALRPPPNRSAEWRIAMVVTPQ